MTKNSPHLPEQRLVLPNVSWRQFETLLVEIGQNRTARFTYARGRLEMMTPMADHERCRKLVESLILVMGGEIGVMVAAIAPVLLIHRELQCGIQPDACYYLKSQAIADQPQEIDEIVTVELPNQAVPDLLVEVAMTKSALNKFAIYASLGVPEVWQYVTTSGEDVLKGEMRIYRLQNQAYIECTHSLAFPFLPSSRILQFLQHSDTLSLQKAIALLQNWCMQHL